VEVAARVIAPPHSEGLSMGRGQSALERVQRIPRVWSDELRSFNIARSSLRLVVESLRRVAEWVVLSGRGDNLTARDVLTVDLAGLLLPELVVAPALDAELPDPKRLQTCADRIIRNFVRWEASADHPLLATSGLWEPYEPLIRLFERGGELFTHHGFIHVNHCDSFHPKSLREYADVPPMLDLGDHALDRLERELRSAAHPSGPTGASAT